MRLTVLVLPTASGEEEVAGMWNAATGEVLPTPARSYAEVLTWLAWEGFKLVGTTAAAGVYDYERAELPRIELLPPAHYRPAPVQKMCGTCRSYVAGHCRRAPGHTSPEMYCDWWSR